jgi:hypothetical protein
MHSISLIMLAGFVQDVPINMVAQSSLSDSVVADTYLQAQTVFEKRIGCTAPKVGFVYLQDASLQEINKRRMPKPGSGYTTIADGMYYPDSKLIQVASNHPDKRRVLFHELLHFMIMDSEDCKDVAVSVRVQHVIIRLLTEDYVRRNNRPAINYKWFYNELKEMGYEG